MCRTGGPRCTGGGRRNADATASEPSPQVEAVASALPNADGTPTREQVDQLAAALPADRTGWDGSPLDESGRRFYALRESGYTGPINQDGYADTTSEGAGILRRMAERRGETVTW
jgi:hypothetical protein